MRNSTHRTVYLAIMYLQMCITLAYKGHNIILILTDDQDIQLNSIAPMKNVQHLIANEGATFSNAIVTSPICCPSRSSILTGQYLHNHETKNNSISGGCNSWNWQNNFEPHTFASYLHKNGYITFYAGKYLNTYGFKNVGGPSHIPEGWDWWTGLIGNSRYYNYSLSVNGTEHTYENLYLPDLIRDYAVDFLKQKWDKKNFLMVIAPPSPHAPFTPAKRHESSLPNVKALRTPSFNYTSKDKHWLMQMPPTPLPTQAGPVLDLVQRRRLQTLLAIDEMVFALINQLKESNILKDTYIMYTSDNGYHIGQFCQAWDKRQPYDTDIMVPFFIRGPEIPAKTTYKYPISNIDIAPTILDLANIKKPSRMDGQTILKVFEDYSKNLSYDRKILIEYEGEENIKSISSACQWKYDSHLAECSEESWCKCQDAKNNTYNCVRHFRQPHYDTLYCEFLDDDNFIEIYNLSKDPYQLHNIANNFSSQALATFSRDLKLLKYCNGKQCTL